MIELYDLATLQIRMNRLLFGYTMIYKTLGKRKYISRIFTEKFPVRLRGNEGKRMEDGFGVAETNWR